jgi:hypothetical protein
LDRRRPHNRTDRGLRLVVRYTPAFTRFAFGFVKVYPLQFPPAGFRRLSEPFGEFPPMDVLWSFMGAVQPCTTYIVRPRSWAASSCCSAALFR